MCSGMVASVLPVLTGFLYFRKLSPTFKILLVYISCSMLSNLIAFWLAINAQNNYIVFHFYTLVEVLLLLWVFSRWQSAPLMKHLLLAAAVLFSVLWVMAKFTIENFHEMEFFTSSVGQLILAFTAVFTIFQLAHESDGKLFHISNFWVSLAVLFYAGGTVFIYSLTQEVIHEVWIMKIIIVTIYYLIISWSFRIEAVKQ